MNTETQQLIEKLYVDDRMSQQEVSEQIGCSKDAVANILRQRGLVRSPTERIRKNLFNQSFFETIDSHEKAQILGLWYADGNVRIQKLKRDSVNYSCRIQLAAEDKDYTDEVNRRLGCTTNLTFIKRAKPEYQDSYAIIMYSKKMFDDLVDKGCVPRKSLILQFPTLEQVPEQFVSSFMAGYFEGDGCICISAVRGYPNSIQGVLTITSTREFCLSYGAVLEKECDVHCSLCRHKGRLTNNYVLSIAGNRQVIRVMDFLYKDAPFVMKRKHDKHDVMISAVSKSIADREAKKTKPVLSVS